MAPAHVDGPESSEGVPLRSLNLEAPPMQPSQKAALAAASYLQSQL